ncbi:hypothetical protein CAPTEDRAFT_201966 [Capitella teleta]|uniref:Uncharacterized protein n=1 Tax=Capitella teleta TaxID=283909 RepID=R7V2I1_CAPTE|nr:hypothetical protein CAPTEDRAFT_201966 [Capitella teleta]|eukprot:ELU09916.1 hypothetical protein CAPTEDRAFT_201966 [Capitella teleta]
MLKIDKNPESQHVRDCMTWHYGYSASRERTPHSSAGGGNSNDRVHSGTNYATGYTFNPSQDTDYIPQSTYVYSNTPEKNLDQMQCAEKQDKVIDALRGWPGDRLINNTSGFDRNEDVEPQNDPSKDPYMADLMAHAYMKNKTNKQKDGSASANKRANLKSGGKPTRTSMMRHIVNNEKAHPVQSELWKMPKFTKGAKSTNASRRSASGGKSRAAPEGAQFAGVATGFSPSGYGFGADATQNVDTGCSYGNPYESYGYDTAAATEPYTYTNPGAMTSPPATDNNFKLPPISSTAAQDQAYTYNYNGNGYDARPPSNGVYGASETRFSPDKQKSVSFEVAL